AQASLHWPNSLEPYYPVPWTNSAYHCPGYRGSNFLTRLNQDPWPSYGSYAYNSNGAENANGNGGDFDPGYTSTRMFLGLGVNMVDSPFTVGVPPTAESRIL